jgi:hypothetical protein
MPLSSFLGLNSADHYEKVGVEIPGLSSKKIFPIYGVWPPTQSHLYKLFHETISSTVNLNQGNKNCIDLGTGSGALGFILGTLGKDFQIFSIDKTYEAIRCSKLNA